MIMGRLLLMGLVLSLLGACGKQGNKKEAQTYFKMAWLELSDESLEPRLAYTRALAYLDKALEQEEKAEFYALRGTVLFKLGDYDQSEASFKVAYDLEPDALLKAETMNNHACLLAEKGDFKGALAMWEQLQKNTAYQTPEVAWVNAGKVYAQQGLLNKAQYAFAKASQLSPSYLDAHFYTALMAERLGDRQQAQISLRTVLSMEPGHEGALAMMSRLGVNHQIDCGSDTDCA